MRRSSLVARWLAAASGTPTRQYSGPSTSGRHTGSNPTGPAAFCFDIDGVLIRGRRVLPAAREMAQQLHSQGAWRVPTCFITNGGGVTEAKKAEQLSSWLGVRVDARQVILSHTPMRALARTLGTRPVLLAGRGEVADVAASYGFKKVLTTGQLAAALPTALPFRAREELGGSRPGPAGPCPVRDLGWGSEQQPIAAALVMTDPHDWYQDLQLLIDVITAHGVPGRSSPLPGSQPIPLVFSNPDLLWAAEHNRPRFGQGAFAAALDALHKRLTGSQLPNAKWFGKPNAEPFRLAERLLLEQAVGLGLTPHTSAQGLHAAEVFSNVFMVGDNPAADVRGANQAGAPWVSVLVRTGVFQGPGPNSTSDPAHVVVDDCLAAVRAGLHRARSSRWHSMR